MREKVFNVTQMSVILLSPKYHFQNTQQSGRVHQHLLTVYKIHTKDTWLLSDD